MDSFELNKILGAVLGTCLILLALNIAAEAIFTAPKPERPGYAIAVPEQAAGPSDTAAAQEQPIEVLLASADPQRGEQSAKVCQTCHTFEKGGPTKTGPNLWGVVGRPRASVPGFNYSQAMKSKGGTWTVDELNKFLANPKGYIPGTNMTFGGLPRGNQRADVIAYLNSRSDNPQPLPTAAQAPGQPGPQAQQPNAQSPNAAQPSNTPAQTPAPGPGQNPAAKKK